jgi:hypothetical protein
MSLSILCHGCGKRFDLPDDFKRRKKQCPFCGVMCDVAGATAGAPAPPAAPPAQPVPVRTPPPVREAIAERVLVARDPRPADAPVPLAEETPVLPADPTAPTITTACPQCRAPVAVPSGRHGPIRCPRCAMLVADPSFGGTDAVRPAARPAQHVHHDEGDDGNPYAVVDTGERPCPECGNRMAAGDVVCMDCGFNRQTGRKPPKRVFDRVDRSWEAGWPFKKRLLVFGALQGSFFLIGMIMVALKGNVGTFIGTWIGFTLMLSFVTGTYDRLDLARNKRGAIRLSKTWRLCFFPFRTDTIDWREYQGVVVGLGYTTGFLDWLVMVNLLVLGVVPGIIWFTLMNRDSYLAALTREHGFPALTLYQGWSQEHAEDIARTLHEVAGYPYEGN